MSRDPADELLMYMERLTPTEVPVEEKVAQVVSVAGCDENVARFYLEANNWSVDLAVSSFFDNAPADQTNQPYDLMPQCAIVEETLPQTGQPVTLNTTFQKGWILENTGNVPWPEDSRIVFSSGNPMYGPQEQLLAPMPPGERTQVVFELSVPDLGAETQVGAVVSGTWVIVSPEGRFGPALNVTLTVEGDGENEETMAD